MTSSASGTPKRNVLRKGTHSCWECKRRKMKCNLDSTMDGPCSGCRRRGSPCVTQDTPEDEAFDPMTSRKRKFTQPAPKTQSQHDSATTIPSSYIPNANLSLEKLSEVLHSALPTLTDTQIIHKACPTPRFHAYEVLTTPYTSLMIENGSTDDLCEVPSSHTHPVLLARYMFTIASFLQHFDSSVNEDVKALSQSPKVISKRLSSLAIDLVTTKDELIGSLEGLECILLESVYHANAGHIRRSWLSARRAISVAQLMGLNRAANRAHFKILDPKNTVEPRLLWFRMIFLDRSLSLMLGLPQACSDYDMTAAGIMAHDVPLNHLEKLHCAIAARSLDRNHSCPSPEDFQLTRTLDIELQKAARKIPSQWWLTPIPGTTQTISLSTRRIFAQVLHFNLLNQLHLPFMLRSTWDGRDCSYSRMTCVHASREVIMRYTALRGFNNIECSCRIVDFLALMAAMTLLLAHLDSDPDEIENPLGHQYSTDRAMVQQVQQDMVNSKQGETLSAHSAQLLGQLLMVDQPHDTEKPSSNGQDVVSLHVPYFGIIEIADQGVRLVETSARAGVYDIGQRRSAATSHTIGTKPQVFAAQARSRESPGNYQTAIEDAAPHWWQYTDDTEFTGDTVDWLLPGIDMAFVNTAYKSAGYT